jgi:probable rRNA maturation factor
MKKKTNLLDLDIQFATNSLAEKWADIITKSKVKRWMLAALLEDASITLRLVGRAESKKLNSAYRNKDYATNVLTFPYGQAEKSGQLLADIVICLPVVEKEAKDQNKALLSHLTHLIVHGTLHAQGFDHEDDVEAEAMEALEVAILKKLKLANPYV